MRTNKIKVFYTPKQVLQSDSASNYSKSPLKPKLLLEHLTEAGLDKNLDIVSKFRPYNAYDFQIAHTVKYINAFFSGTDGCSTNGLSWSPQFADSVRYTNASLFEAIQNALVNPSEVSFSPTSGFHHAKPDRGSGFCTFSGQVIASVKLYRKYGAVGCYIDLDGHYGNSIEDSRKFQPDVNEAIPVGFNFNTREHGKMYLKQLKSFVLNKLQPAILTGRIDYVVWCHGADSHEDDNLGNQVSTEIWLECAKFFWSWVKEMDEILGRPLPVACALFGGYRDDDYDSVLSLHASDLAICMNELLGLDVEYETKVKVNERKRYLATLPPARNYSLEQYGSTYSNTSMQSRKRSKEQSDQFMKRQLERLNSGGIIDEHWDFENYLN